MESDSYPAPVRKLDPQQIVAEIEAVTGQRIELIGRTESGEVGAAFVRMSDGNEAVLTISGEPVENIRESRRILEHVRRVGIPVPLYESIVETSGGVVILQRRLKGTPPKVITDHLVDRMMDQLDQFQGILADNRTVPELDLYLTKSGPGFCLHESLQAHDDETRALLKAIRRIGNMPTPTQSHGDLVHTDFHPGNILVDEKGTITGIVDWDGLSRGDRRFGLVTLAFDLSWRRKFRPTHTNLTDEGQQRLLTRLHDIDPTMFQSYWAHMSLRLVDWAIRHHTNDEVDHYVAFARRAIDF